MGPSDMQGDINAHLTVLTPFFRGCFRTTVHVSLRPVLLLSSLLLSGFTLFLECVYYSVEGSIRQGVQHQCAHDCPDSCSVGVVSLPVSCVFTPRFVLSGLLLSGFAFSRKCDYYSVHPTGGGDINARLTVLTHFHGCFHSQIRASLSPAFFAEWVAPLGLYFLS